MSNFFWISKELDSVIKSHSNKEEAWKFFLRRNLRSQAFNKYADQAFFFQGRSSKVEVLRNKFEEIYGKHFTR